MFLFYGLLLIFVNLPLIQVLSFSVYYCSDIICNIVIQIGMAAAYPEPDDKEAFIQSQMYDWNFPSIRKWSSFTKHT
jgi:hypothetical protein